MINSFGSSMNYVTLTEDHKIRRAEIVFDLILILQSNKITIGEDRQLICIANEPTDVQISTFLCNFQQLTKEAYSKTRGISIDQEAYSGIC